MDHLHEAAILFSSEAFVIREATPADCSQLHDLSIEFDADLWRDDYRYGSAAIEEPDSYTPSCFTTLVAVDTCDRTHAPKRPEDGTSDTISSSDVLIGFVRYTYSFVPEGKKLEMEELFVTSDHRSKGVGKELMRTILKIGLEEGAQSCRFEVYDWNAQAIAFYKSWGAQDLTASKGIHVYDIERMDIIVFETVLSVDGVAMVRPVEDTDMDEVLEMQQHYDEELEEHRNRLTQKELSEVVFSSSPSCYLVVAEDHGGALLGFASFSKSFSPQLVCFESWEVTELYVKPSSRRQSVGSYLLQQVVKKCLSLGCMMCRCFTAPDSGIAVVLNKLYDGGKEIGLQVMYMDKDSLMKMVNCDQEKALG